MLQAESGFLQFKHFFLHNMARNHGKASIYGRQTRSAGKLADYGRLSQTSIGVLSVLQDYSLEAERRLITL
jgi:hypothetical protein